MNRRSIFAAAGAAGAAAATLAAPAIAQTQAPEVRWRLASSFPRNLDILFGTAEHVARRVAQITGNRFQIRTFPAGEIVPGLQVLDAVQAGTVECGQTASYYYIGKDPSFAFFTIVPFGLTSRQMHAWMREGGGSQLANELYGDYGMVGFSLGDTGAQMGGWFRNELRGVQDVQGLKFRIAGLGGLVFQRLGAVTQQLAGGDIYPALERGVIDATEWVGPYDDEKLGFVRVARYYYAPGFWEPCAQGVLLVNRRAFEALPEAYRHALETACGEASVVQTARYDHHNPLALRRLVAAGAQLRFWPREVMQAAWRETHGLYEELSSRNPRFKKIWESYRRYRDEEFQWFRIAENSFENFSYAAAQGGR
ncbi:MAG: TRAP transporter substrate-binding protein DctP [Acetobacteraceae bacterium]|nr:TRAP transporter substrate-binding protein DctP [Acetobacteraceae bacterium]